MTTLNKIWVLAEKQGALAELCAGGRELGQEVSAVVIGSKVEADKAIAMGADKVYWLGALKADQMLEDYTKTILALLKQEEPNLLLVQPSRRGKLLAGRLAAGLGTSVIVDAAGIEIADDGKVQAAHMVYGGAAFRTEKALSETAIVTVGSGTFTALAEDGSRQGVVIEADFVEPATKVKVLEKKIKAGTSVNLAAAKKVIGIGRGFSNKEDIKMAEELACLLDAELGCSRPLAEGVDWLPRERYIGVSGVVLKSDVYLAIGISGQVQHMVGVNQARVVISINKDKTAPIFQQSDYGVVGDLYKVVPALIEKIKAVKQ
ncbi:electron transfer flavoprotein subunit alpha/FixB family protein [Desulfitobacterium chlororespirans]|uniref:Electron transfer flavoprotein alpha subunit apoprotein n=1 Tax=Desulfitobacterium chlororespirans DSM 11544 TaxID=1121395 RepID=A0A1M7UZ55_9FIRM|nr:FAD-binding protein [Desulfitobacterium chlororespirans]SHN88283.1 electron transfer flavoprotein alpha subunit apoprotein [Desulfitobacterium chlororespirans DSM 11544]